MAAAEFLPEQPLPANVASSKAAVARRIVFTLALFAVGGGGGNTGAGGIEAENVRAGGGGGIIDGEPGDLLGLPIRAGMKPVLQRGQFMPCSIFFEGTDSGFWHFGQLIVIGMASPGDRW